MQVGNFRIYLALTKASPHCVIEADHSEWISELVRLANIHTELHSHTHVWTHTRIKSIFRQAFSSASCLHAKETSDDHVRLLLLLFFLSFAGDVNELPGEASKKFTCSTTHNQNERTNEKPANTKRAIQVKMMSTPCFNSSYSFQYFKCFLTFNLFVDATLINNNL